MKVEILRGVTVNDGTPTKPGDKVTVSTHDGRYLISLGKAKEIKTVRKPKKDA